MVGTVLQKIYLSCCTLSVTVSAGIEATKSDIIRAGD